MVRGRGDDVGEARNFVRLAIGTTFTEGRSDWPKGLQAVEYILTVSLNIFPQDKGNNLSIWLLSLQF